MRKGDRDGVVRGFETMESDAGHVLASIVQERSDMKEAAKQQ
jgi:transcriptional regulator